jgi:hypothetical protein
LTDAHLGSILNFDQLSCTAKFKIEPKCAADKVTPLTEVALEKITQNEQSLSSLSSNVFRWNGNLSLVSQSETKTFQERRKAVDTIS